MTKKKKNKSWKKSGYLTSGYQCHTCGAITNTHACSLERAGRRETSSQGRCTARGAEGKAYFLLKEYLLRQKVDRREREREKHLKENHCCFISYVCSYISPWSQRVFQYSISIKRFRNIFGTSFVRYGYPKDVFWNVLWFHAVAFVFF